MKVGFLGGSLWCFGVGILKFGEMGNLDREVLYSKHGLSGVKESFLSLACD